ncbi:LpxI family protein [Alienimonas sp. DA493]|uniref:LpxI family protein n=1 Tax=Alienimonas sp. DA493 TaxID=3373605 RepID=UPI003754890B
MVPDRPPAGMDAAIDPAAGPQALRLAAHTVPSVIVDPDDQSLDRPLQAPPPGRVGLLAGAGKFPFRFAQAARAGGHEVFAVGVQGMCDPELADYCDGYREAPICKAGSMIRKFRRAGVREVVMAGKVTKTVFFEPWRVFKLMPDWRALSIWFHHARRDKKDDTLLLAVIAEFARSGLTVGSALDYAPELLVPHGFLTDRQPTPKQWEDIRFGWTLAKEMGRLDVGQSICVADKAVMAVEAIEGTDKCIERAGELCRRGGFTVVKVAKPQQDRRFDVPTVGETTLRTMHAAGARVLAIESGKTIMIDRGPMMDLADRLGIAVVSLNAEELSLKAAA